MEVQVPESKKGYQISSYEIGAYNSVYERQSYDVNPYKSIYD
jgi:hypothetical protein